MDIKKRYNVSEIEREIQFTLLRISSRRIFVKISEGRTPKTLPREIIQKIMKFLEFDPELDLVIIPLNNPDFVIVDLRKNGISLFPYHAKKLRWENFLSDPEKTISKIIWSFLRMIIKQKASHTSTVVRFLFEERKFPGTIEKFFRKLEEGRVHFRADPEWLKKIIILLAIDGLYNRI